MNKIKKAIRLLTLFCYLMPFATCNNFPSEVVTIQSVDTSFIATNNYNNTSEHNDTIGTNPLVHSISNDSIRITEDNSFWSDVLSKTIYPTDDSISGLGAILLSNTVGQIAVSLSLLLSLFLLFEWKFIKIKNRRGYFLLATLLCISTFIFNGLIVKEVLRWGVWLLLGLVVLQIFIEYYEFFRANQQHMI